MSVILIIVLAVIAAALIVPKLLGYEQYAVLTGSMEPGIRVGSIVCDERFDAADGSDVSNLAVGQVVTYQLGSGTLVTHRIVEINEAEGTVVTQGDANNTPDSEPVPYEKIVGTYAFDIPFLGYISIYSRTPLGITAVCAILIIILLLNFLPEVVGEKR